MERRDFLSLAPALAGHFSRVLTAPPRSAPVGRQRGRRRGRQQAAILLLVVPPANWRPRSWRDIPPVSAGAPTIIVDHYGPHAIGVCRAAAKRHNTAQTRTGVSTWAVVACNDGRYHQRPEGGAL